MILGIVGGIAGAIGALILGIVGLIACPFLVILAIFIGGIIGYIFLWGIADDLYKKSL